MSTVCHPSPSLSSPLRSHAIIGAALSTTATSPPPPPFPSLSTLLLLPISIPPSSTLIAIYTCSISLVCQQPKQKPEQNQTPHTKEKEKMDSLRRSFKSHGSYKRSPSSIRTDLEDQPILSDHRDEVVVNVDGNSHRYDQTTTATSSDSGGSGNGAPKVWREESYFFRKNSSNGGGGGGFTFPRSQQNPALETGEDPPSRLISSFLHKQKASGVEGNLDIDLEMDELKKTAHSPSSSSVLASKELRVSFQDPSSETLRRRNASNNDSSSSSLSSSSSDNKARNDRDREQQRAHGLPPRPSGAQGEVLKCTSRAYDRGASTLLRAKTRSRLMDPPRNAAAAGDGDNDQKPQAPTRAASMARSGMLRSGVLGKQNQNNTDDEEDDPFASEDVPDEYNRSKFNMLTVIQWVSLVLILGALACSLAIPLLERQTLWNLHLWKWEVLVLVLICGRLVSGWCIRIVVFFVERNFLLRKRVLYFVYGIRKAVQNCLWLGLVLLAWHFLFDKKVERETKSKTLPYVTKVLVCLLVATLFWLVKTLLVKVLASSFHVSTYFDRIQESLFNQYVIETLSGPPVVELQNAREEEERVLLEIQKLQNAGATVPQDLREAMMPNKSGAAGGGSGRGIKGVGGKSVRFSGSVHKKDGSKQLDEGITIEHLHKLNQNNVSAWNMKRLMKIVRHGALSTLDEQITDAGGEDESTMKIRSEYEAKKAAKKIFTNVAKPGAKYIYLVDLVHFMTEDEAVKAMSLFDGAQEAKKVSRSSLKNWVVNAFRERRALSLTLNDTKTAVKKLHHMCNMIVGIIVFVIWLLILGIATSHLLVLMSSQLLLAVFIFGNTCKTTFEAIVFLFVMHPFDVGDRCDVDGVQMIVEEMNILTTVFLRYDGLKITYPNSVLSTKTIANFYRSPDMGDAIDFCIHISTPVEKIAIMKERIKGFIEGKKEHWYPSPSIVLRDVEDMNRLKVSVWFQHRINHQDMGERWTRREQVVQEMIKCFRELDIEYRMLPLDVNLRNLPPLESARLPSTWTTLSG